MYGTNNHNLACECLITFENHDGPTINRLVRQLASRFKMGSITQTCLDHMRTVTVDVMGRCRDLRCFSPDTHKAAAVFFVENWLMEFELGNIPE